MTRWRGQEFLADCSIGSVGADSAAVLWWMGSRRVRLAWNMGPRPLTGPPARGPSSDRYCVILIVDSLYLIASDTCHALTVIFDTIEPYTCNDHLESGRRLLDRDAWWSACAGWSNSTLTPSTLLWTVPEATQASTRQQVTCLTADLDVVHPSCART